VLEHVELPESPLPYGERVIGIGKFQFVPIPKQASDDSAMADIWRGRDGAGAEPLDRDGNAGPQAESPEKVSATRDVVGKR